MECNVYLVVRFYFNNFLIYRLWDTYDVARAAALRILQRFPRPLPGYKSIDKGLLKNNDFEFFFSFFFKKKKKLKSWMRILMALCNHWVEICLLDLVDILLHYHLH